MAPRNRYVDALSVLFVLATFSFIWRVRTSFFIPVPEPFEILIFAIGCVLAVGFLRLSLPRIGEFVSGMKRYRFVLAVILVAPLLGLLGSSLAGFDWLEYAREVAKEYVRLLVAVFFFAVAVYAAFLRPRITKPVLVAIAASPLPLWFALIPSWQPFFLHTDRLRGAGNDPNYLAIWIAVGLVASVVFFLWEQGRVRWLWLGNGFVIAPLLLWAASRAAWSATAIVLLVVGVLFLAERFSRERLRLLLTVFLGLMASLVIGFSLFPVPSRAVIATRALSPLVGGEQISRNVSLVAGGAEVVSSDVFTTEKIRLWSEGAKRLAESPLGFGPAYYFWQPVGVVQSMGREHKLDVHNLWLGVGLAGGWLGLGAWIFFVVLLARAAVRMWRSGDPQSIASAASFFALLLAGFFMDIFTLRWFWLVMGLIVAYSFVYEGQKEA